MFTKPYRLLVTKICFTVFLLKMLISATPIFVNVIDKGTILMVVLQLEIEITGSGNNLSEDLHESGSKFFYSTHYEYAHLSENGENYGRVRHYLKNDRNFMGFHPTVPTPPPNC